ncbi:MAG: hypothetical protein AB7Q42_21660 [Acidimicrobiia bacterium]
MRRSSHRGAAALAAAFAAAVLAASPASSAPPDASDSLLDQIGPGWVADEAAASTGALGLTKRVFTNAHGRLELSVLPTPASIDPRMFVTQMASAGLGVPEIENTGLPDSYAFGGGDPGGEQVHILLFAANGGAFVFRLDTSRGAAWEPMALLVELAEQQIERAGEPAGGPTVEVPDEVRAYLAEDPPPQLPDVVSSETIGGSENVEEDVGGNAEVVRFLNEHTVSGVRLWHDPSFDLTYAASVTQYPFAQFAAVALASFADDGYEPASVPGLDGVDGVRTFRGVGGREAVVGAAFRRGQYLFVVLAQSTDRSRAEAAVAAATTQHLEIAPQGPSSAAGLPSPQESVLRSALLVGGAGAGLLGVRRARVARRVARRPLVEPGAGVTVIDISADAVHHRRVAIRLAAAQIAGWVITIVGVAADVPLWARASLVVLGVGGGLVVTEVSRRRDLARVGQAPPRWRPTVPAVRGLAWLTAGVAALLLGVAGVVWGLRELVFLPSLTHLKFADDLHVEPRRLALSVAVGGAIAALAGSGLLRLGRARARADASTLRRADARPPVLYLRSFEDDDLGLPSVLSPRRPFAELFTLRTADPFEEAIAWELSTYGPVTAVGRPGRSLASLGAAREHLTNDSWQAGVVERMAEARSIVIVPGITSGLQWEVGTAVAAGHLDKTVFVLPPVDRAQARERWRIVCAPLPEPFGSGLAQLDVDSVLTVRIVHGEAIVTVGLHHDEADYRAATDDAMAAAGYDARTALLKNTSAWPSGAPGA